ncbi:hypothetical protein [Algisphaera agarilytica]|uniref:Integral membrane protein n=1 Tax=Algisphaera agarilytica TaxID=1385975 RepID=A0A7X0H5C3_9BACT|nr:hypothetical protein [Algisphaera agarilytica]MBB6429418.1 hypothetical protein [Algisphaera agarilytica]
MNLVKWRKSPNPSHASACLAFAAMLGVAGSVCAQSTAFGPMQVVGQIEAPAINESSGLAAARAPGNEGLFWTHNDSGDKPRLFLIDGTGELQAEYQVDAPFATDWEDIASFELNGEPYLLVGDVGDNAHKRQRVTLWLIPEPSFDPDRQSAFPLKMEPLRRIDFTYADGPKDCESIAFDPASNNIVIVTKVDPRRLPVGYAGVYFLPLPAESSSGLDEPIVVERAANLSLRITVGMDIAPDSRRAIVATYGDAWLYTRNENQSWVDAFQQAPEQIALGPRGQSEAIAFDAKGESIYLTAEGVGKPFWRVPRVERE